MTTRHLLDLDDALVAVVDIQANHYPTVFDGAAYLERMVRFVSAARVLDVPVVWTEHYPRAFGPTLPELAAALAGLEPIPKTDFGCFGEAAFAEAVAASGRGTLVVVGAETHICIEQTALMGLERKLRVAVLADCVTAQRRLDHDVALQRMRATGVVVTTWIALVYEWMRRAKHPAFRQVLPIVKGE